MLYTQGNENLEINTDVLMLSVTLIKSHFCYNIYMEIRDIDSMNALLSLDDISRNCESGLVLYTDWTK